VFDADAASFTLSGNNFGMNSGGDEYVPRIDQLSSNPQTIAINQFSFGSNGAIIALDGGDLTINSTMFLDASPDQVNWLDIYRNNGDSTLTFNGSINKGGSGFDPNLWFGERAVINGAVNLGHTGPGDPSQIYVADRLELGSGGAINSAVDIIAGSESYDIPVSMWLTTAGQTLATEIRLNNYDKRVTIGGMNASGTVTFSGPMTDGPDEHTVGYDLVATTGGVVDFSGTRNFNHGLYVNRPDGATTYGGTVRLSNSTNSTEWTALEGGTLEFSNFNQLGAAHFEFNASSGDSGTLRYTGGTTTTTKSLFIDNSGITRAAIDVSDPATVLTWNPGSANLTANVTKSGAGTLSFGGAITGAATVRTEGGTLILTAANTFTGGVTLSAGTLALGSANALGSSGTISFGGGRLQYSASNTTDYSGRFSNAAGQQYSIDTNGQNVTLGSNLTSSGGSFTKLGSGNLVLSGSSSYSGATTVSAGRLSVNGSLGATAVTVQNAAELGGAGSIAGALAILAGGTLSPGNSIESLTAGATTFSGSSTFAYEYDSTNPASLAAAADLLVVNGDLSIGSGAIITFDDLATSPLPFTDYTTVFALINYAGTWNNGLFTYGGTPLADESTFSVGGQQWQIDYNRTSSAGLDNFTGDYLSSSSFVTITAVPEPSTCVMALAGLACGGYLVRRRRKRA
jgi:autotransporter-associated beta strand protein